MTATLQAPKKRGASSPTSWRKAKFSEVCIKISDGTHHSPHVQHSEPGKGRFKYVTSKNIRPWGLDLGDIAYVDEPVHREIYSRCQPEFGDVLLTKDGANTGNVAINTLDEEFSLLSSVALLKPKRDVLETRFLRYYIESPIGSKRLLGEMTGTAIRRIILKKIKDTEILLPPLDEQRQIVAEIEKQFTRLEAGVTALKRVQANLKRYRAAVLKAACEGKLVPTEAELAKAEGRSYETGEQLLQRILTERRKNWSGRGKYKEPVAPGTANLQPFLQGWTIASLEQLTSATRPICYGILMPKENVETGVLFVKVKDMKGDKVDLAGLHRTTPEIAAKYARSSLSTGDLLLSIRGTYGRVAEVPMELDGGNITQDTARLDVTDLVSHRYVATYLRNPDCQNHFKHVARGVAVKGVNIGDVRPTPIPLPPIAEQKRIVEEVERRLSVIDELESVLKSNLQRATRLRQSILQNAYTGKLTKNIK